MKPKPAIVRIMPSSLIKLTAIALAGGLVIAGATYFLIWKSLPK